IAGLLLYLRIDVNSGYLTVMLPPELLTGFGFGLVVVAATVAATSEAGPSESGMVSGLFNVTQQVGISLGIAVQVSVAAGVTGALVTPESLISGYRAAFMVAALLATGGLAAALTLLPGRRPPSPGELTSTRVEVAP